MAFKTVVINEECKINLEQNSIVVNIENERLKIFISDLNCVIFNHQKVVITIPIISKLLEENVAIIICNKKNDPIGSFLPFNTNSLPFKQLQNQIDWKLTRKKKLWKKIIENKIKSEYEVLKVVGKKFPEDKFLKYISEVKSGDSTNREGVAAKMYFKIMFGHEYFRNEVCSRNYALNYGYKIIASYISKHIVARGYLTQLGIKHCSGSNAYNLTYDFIETFRVIIDLWVYTNISEDDHFSVLNRMELVDTLNAKVKIGTKDYHLTTAILMIIDSYFAYLLGETEDIIEYKVDSIQYED